MVTSPAPARSAPRAASRAAPVEESPPDTTTAWPRPYLCPSVRGTGKLLAQSSGPLTPAPRLDLLEHVRADPDVGHTNAPAMKPAGQQHMADLAAEERHRFRGLDRETHHRPGRAVDAARQIDRKDAAAQCSWPRSWRARRLRPGGRDQPRTAHRRRSRPASGRPVPQPRRDRSSAAPPGLHPP